MRTAIILVTAAVLVPACAKPAVQPVARLPELSAVREYVVPWENAYPNDAVVDSVGRVWFTDRLTHAIGRFDPATEEFSRYPVPTPLSAPYGMVAAPDGGLWYAGSRAGLLGRVDPATAQITEYRLPDAEGGPHLLAWRDGAVWFTLREGRGYGRIDAATGESVVYRLASQRPYGITATADAIWMSAYGSFRLLEVDPATGDARIHDLSEAAWSNPQPLAPAVAGRPQRIWPGQTHRVASDGTGGVWFTDFTRSRIVRYDIATGELHGWESLEQRSEPYGIAVMSSGRVVYSERNANRIIMLDPATDERVRARIPTAGGVARDIAVDERRGRIWLPLSDSGRLGLIEFR